MTWMTFSAADKAVVEEIERQTDRGAALIAVAFLETKLKQALVARFDPSPNAKVIELVFGRDGALASLSRKIDLGYLLQLYPDEVREVLHRLRDIRNDFAHRQEPIDFQDQSIKDTCKHLSDTIGRAVAAAMHHCFGIQTLVTQFARQPIMRRRALDDWNGGPVAVQLVGLDPRQTFLNVVKWLLIELAEITTEISHMQLEFPPLSAFSPAPTKQQKAKKKGRRKDGG